MKTVTVLMMMMGYICIINIALLLYMDNRFKEIRSDIHIDKTEPKHDYKVDLKPNYIIVYSKGGNVDTIPYSIDRGCMSPIEGFFERDNL